MSDSLDHPKYRPDIDGLRAIAVLSVVGFHAAPGRVPGGFIGVDIFFVISGFLISSIILKGLQTDRFSLLEFYSRRIKRIFPALLVLLLSCLFIGYFLLLDDELRELAKHITAGAGFVSNVLLWSESGYFDHAADMKPLLHLWSLGIEEQFYIVWPVMLWLAWRRRFAFLMLTLALCTLSFALNVMQIGSDPVAAFYLPFTRFWELLTGAALAAMMLQSEPAAPQHTVARNVASFFGVALLAAAFLLINKERAFPGWWAALPVIGAAFVIWAGTGAWINRKLLSNPVLVWFGLISFPLYLWHWPALSFMRILEGTEPAQWKRLVAMGFAVFLAWLTYEFIEKKIRHRRGAVVSVALFSLMVIVGSVGAYGYYARGFEGRIYLPKVANEGDIEHYAFFNHISKNYFPCTPDSVREQTDTWNGFLRCFQSKKTELKDIVILGDSHAEHLFPGLAARMPGSNVVFYIKGSMPTLDNIEYERILKVLLTDKHIASVLITTHWPQKIKESPNWKADLIRLIAALRMSGKRVYLIDDVPSFSFFPSKCKYVGRLFAENKCTESDRLHDVGYKQTLNEIAAEFDDVEVINIYPLFCDSGICSMAKNGVLLYRDDNHLNVSGSLFVADAIVAQMRKP